MLQPRFMTRGDIPALFTKLDSRLTGAIRSKPQSEIYSSLPTITGHSPPSLVPGTAWTNETYISVHWPRLAYPIALEALTALFLVITIWQTVEIKMQPWKSTILLLLFHGLKDEFGFDPLRPSELSR